MTDEQTISLPFTKCHYTSCVTWRQFHSQVDDVSSFLIVIYLFSFLSFFFFLQTRITFYLMGILKSAMLGRVVMSKGVTAHRLSKNVTFYMNELAPPVSLSPTQVSKDHKPLMLMLPWLGSRPQAVGKYCEIYFRTGYDVLVVESEVRTRHTANAYRRIQKNMTSFYLVSALYHNQKEMLVLAQIKPTS